jgi:hypothetical protein
MTRRWGIPGGLPSCAGDRLPMVTTRRPRGTSGRYRSAGRGERQAGRRELDACGPPTDVCSRSTHVMAVAYRLAMSRHQPERLLASPPDVIWRTNPAAPPQRGIPSDCDIGGSLAMWMTTAPSPVRRRTPRILQP